ncbi:RidA family protein [Streptomyces shenzhenensis]|uniref:RidA family protein n=1 Tax=Streptomyces shenzhenensis TaxID=943815 RepID=UPI0033FAB59A
MSTPDTSPESRVRALGLEIPDYADPPYGGRYGTVKAFHRTGRLVMLSGITAEDRQGNVFNPGRLGDSLTVEQGYAAARRAAVNTLGLMRLALGSLDEVGAVATVLGFVVATPEFEEHHLVGQAVNDVYVDVFGRDRGVSGRAFIGASSLARRNAVELWVTIEALSDPAE